MVLGSKGVVIPGARSPQLQDSTLWVKQKSMGLQPGLASKGVVIPVIRSPVLRTIEWMVCQ